MRRFHSAVLILAAGICFASVAGGCAANTPEQEARIAELRKANDELTAKLADVTAKVRAGTATAAEMADMARMVAEQIRRNIDEIGRIESEGGSTAAAVWGTVGGVLGRSAIHAMKVAIPAGLPGGGILSGLLTLILGGSGTSKPKDPTKSTD